MKRRLKVIALTASLLLTWNSPLLADTTYNITGINNPPASYDTLLNALNLERTIPSDPAPYKSATFNLSNPAAAGDMIVGPAAPAGPVDGYYNLATGAGHVFNSITITGQTSGQYKLGFAPASNNVRLFYITDTAALNLNNLDISGGNLTMGPGATQNATGSALFMSTPNIHPLSRVDITNVTIHDNSTRVTQNGSYVAAGAVIIMPLNAGAGASGAITFDNAALLNNSATRISDNAGSNAHSGAARLSNMATLLIKNSRINGNSVTLNGQGSFAAGGGLRIDVFDNSATTIQDTVFQNNTATTNVTTASAHASGGALYFLNTTAGKELASTISGSAFTGNQATAANLGLARGGAIHFEQNQTGSLSGNTFTQNSATSANGAAQGGAISINSGLATGGPVFTLSGNNYANNSAGGATGALGGAVYANKNILSRDEVYTGNQALGAGALGGAVYLHEAGSFAAVDRNVVFRQNLANGVANALYVNNSGNGNALALGAAAGRHVTFFDPIAGSAVNTGLSIAVNNGAGQTGMVLFDGSLYPGAGPGAIANRTSTVYGATTVHQGSFGLKDGAIYTHGAGSFTLNSGAVLAITGLGNMLEAPTVDLHAGSNMAFNMTGIAIGNPAMLTINAAAMPGRQIGADDILVTNFTPPPVGQLYNLVDAGAAGRTINTGQLYVAGQLNIPQRSTVAGATMTGLAVDPLEQFLQIKTVSAIGNAVLTWTGAVNNTWDRRSADWRGIVNGIGVNTFMDGDSVIFNAAGLNRDIHLPGDVLADTITVSGGVYSYSGPGEIRGVVMDMTGGQADLFTGAHFSGLAQVGDGATLGLSSLGSLSGGDVIFRNGSHLWLEPLPGQTITSTGDIAFEPGSGLALKNLGQAQKLFVGKYDILNLAAGGVVNNQNIPAPTKGSISSLLWVYDYEGLAWNPSGTVLSMLVTDLRVSPPIKRGLDAAITAPGAMALDDAARRALTERADSRFSSLRAPDGQRELNALWVRPSYTYSRGDGWDQRDGYRLKSGGISLGYDRQIGQSAFLGLAMNYSNPEYESTGDDFAAAEVDADNLGVALYGGASLPYAFELSGRTGYSWQSYEQTRRMSHQDYDSDYDGAIFFAGAGLARPFALAENWTLRPGVLYDYLHISVDGYRESSGPASFDVDSFTQRLHRVDAGTDLAWRHENGATVSGRAAYVGIYGDRSGRTTAVSVVEPDLEFTSVGNALDEHNLELGILGELPLTRAFSVGAGYNALLGETTTTQEVRLTLRYEF